MFRLNRLVGLALCLLAIALVIAIQQKPISTTEQADIGAQPVVLRSDAGSPAKLPTPARIASSTLVPQPNENGITANTIPAPLDTTDSTIRVPVSSFYWGARIDGAPFDTSKLDSFENQTARKLDIVPWGQPWSHDGKYQDFPNIEMDKVRARGSIPMLDWASWDLGKGVKQPDFKLSDVYSGKHDAYIRSWALAAKNWRHPFFLRFNHEMNGWWFPWSEQLNGNKSGDYVKAWVHVHDIFTQVGATNAVWVWCPNVTGYSRLTPARELWPGPEYVDWVAMDGFNWGSDDGSYWQSFTDVFQYTYNELTQLAPGKPLMIAEVASSEKGGPQGSPASKAAWILDMFSALPTFPDIKAVLWFNSLDNHPEHSWPLTSSPEALQAVREAQVPLPKFAAASAPICGPACTASSAR